MATFYAHFDVVKEGDKVKQGQVLAQLDPTDYNIRVSDRQATFDKTEKNFNRAKELVQDGAISQSDYDQVEANFRSSEAALKLGAPAATPPPEVS